MLTLAASVAVSPSAAGWPWPLAAGLAAIFAALLLVGLLATSRLRRPARSRGAARVIEHYSGRPGAAANTEGQVAVIAVRWTTRLLRSADLEGKLATRLDLAGIARKPAEWAVLGACLCAALVAAITLFSGSVIAGVLIGTAAGWCGMRYWLSLRISRRRTAFADQLPDILQLIAGSLKAGFSLPQAIDTTARQEIKPASSEFSRALGETRFGVDLTEALDRVADRMESADLRWMTTAIRIQRQVGGNLAEVMRTTVLTMRERAQLRGQVRALSAEGRLSGYVLVGLPILVAGWLFLTARSYLAPLYTTTFGLVMLIGAGILLVLGALWMRSLMKLEV
jgi:tight adherence protein B